MRPFSSGFGVVALAVAAAGLGASAQSLSFSVQRDAPAPESFSMRVDQLTGNGVYQPAAANGSGALAVTQAGSAGTSERPIAVSPALLKKLFAAVPMVKGQHCETHTKKLAQTGKKTLRYTDGSAVMECTYNYSDDDRVNDATTLFEGLGETMMFGDRLALKLRFDRLGLDAELEGLQSAVEGGRALELGNIAPVLQAIMNDDRVMDHVRRKVERMLATADTKSAQAEDAPRLRPR